MDPFTHGKPHITIKLKSPDGKEAQIDTTTEGPNALIGTAIDILTGKGGVTVADIKSIKVKF